MPHKQVMGQNISSLLLKELYQVYSQFIDGETETFKNV